MHKGFHEPKDSDTEEELILCRRALQLKANYKNF